MDQIILKWAVNWMNPVLFLTRDVIFKDDMVMSAVSKIPTVSAVLPAAVVQPEI